MLARYGSIISPLLIVCLIGELYICQNPQDTAEHHSSLSRTKRIKRPSPPSWFFCPPAKLSDCRTVHRAAIPLLAEKGTARKYLEYDTGGAGKLGTITATHGNHLKCGELGNQKRGSAGVCLYIATAESAMVSYPLAQLSQSLPSP